MPFFWFFSVPPRRKLQERINQEVEGLPDESGPTQCILSFRPILLAYAPGGVMICNGIGIKVSTKMTRVTTASNRWPAVRGVMSSNGAA